MEAASRMYLARIALFAGDCEAAEREARVAESLLGSAPPFRPQVMAITARALLHLGRTSEALGAAADAIAAFQSLGTAEGGEALLRLTYAEVLAAAGDAASAAAAISAARDALLASADKLRDPVRRARYLLDIPENARTLELARAWLGEG
jgi:hypothetical protein